MTISAVDLTLHIIKPTLEYLGMYTPAAEDFLLDQAARQSGLDPFCRRDEGIGIYQISPEQHRVAWDNFLAFQSELASKVRGLASQRQFLIDPNHELTTNLAYSTAIAWVIYLHDKSRMVSASTDFGHSQPVNLPQHDAELDFARLISAI